MIFGLTFIVSMNISIHNNRILVQFIFSLFFYIYFSLSVVNLIINYISYFLDGRNINFHKLINFLYCYHLDFKKSESVMKYD